MTAKSALIESIAHVQRVNKLRRHRYNKRLN